MAKRKKSVSKKSTKPKSRKKKTAKRKTPRKAARKKSARKKAKQTKIVASLSPRQKAMERDLEKGLEESFPGSDPVAATEPGPAPWPPKKSG